MKRPKNQDEWPAYAARLLAEIEEHAPKLPSSRATWSDGLLKKSRAIARGVRDTNFATSGQITALENIRDAILAWLPN